MKPYGIIMNTYVADIPLDVVASYFRNRREKYYVSTVIRSRHTIISILKNLGKKNPNKLHMNFLIVQSFEDNCINI